MTRGYRVLGWVAALAGCAVADDPGTPEAVVQSALQYTVTPTASLELPANAVAETEVNGTAISSGDGVHMVFRSVAGLNRPRFLATGRLAGFPNNLSSDQPLPFEEVEGCLPPDNRPAEIAAGFGDGMFLVVTWGRTHLCGARIAVIGEALQDYWPLIIASGSPGRDTSVTFGGGNFLVTWTAEHASDACANPPYERNVCARALRARDGALLDAGPFGLTPPAPADLAADRKPMRQHPRVAFDGANYLVLWTDSERIADGVRVRATDRAILDTQGLKLDLPDLADPDVTFNGVDFLAVWAGATGRSLQGARIGRSDGVLLEGPFPVATVNRTLRLALAGPPDPPLVSWLEYTGVGNGIRLLATTLRPDGRAARTPWLIDNQATPVVFPTWSAGYTRRYDGGVFILGWPDPTTASGMKGMSIALNGLAAGPVPMPTTRTAPAQRYPSAAFDGQHHLVAWSELDSAGYHVRAARLLDPSQSPTPSPAAFSISDRPSEMPLIPRVATNGETHLVTWWDPQPQLIRAVRVRAGDLTVLDDPAIAVDAPFDSSPPSGVLAAASDGRDYLLAWIDGLGSSLVGTGVSVIRISREGGLSPPVPRRVHTGAPERLALGFAGGKYLLSVWDRGPPAAGASGPAIHTRRLDADGTPLEPDAVWPDEYRPSTLEVTRVGERAAVVWSRAQPGTARSILARRIQMSDGTVLDPEPVVFGEGHGETFASASHGDSLSGLWLVPRARQSTSPGMVMVPLWREGAVNEPNAVSNYDLRWPVRESALSVTPSGDAFAAYAVFDWNADTYRIHFDRLRIEETRQDASASSADVPSAPPDGLGPYPQIDGPVPDVAAEDAAAPPDAGMSSLDGVDARSPTGADPLVDAADPEPAPAHGAGRQAVRTGGGGLRCQASPAAPSPPLSPWLLAAPALLLRRWRRRSGPAERDHKACRLW